MGDEEKYATGGFVFRAADGGWENLGHMDEGGVSLHASDEEQSMWAGKLLELSRMEVVA